MTRGTIFIPNFCYGPCIYCNKTSELKPEELLKCNACKRSAHFSCLKSGIPKIRLLGDNFFYFTCQECSPQNCEVVTRAELSFIQTLLLSLYNLHMTKENESSDGYFHYKTHIYNFIKNNWHELYCYDGKHFYKEHTKLFPNRISGQLSHCPLFTSKKVERGRGGWYRLISVESPSQLIHKSQQSQQRKRRSTTDFDHLNKEEPNKVLKTIHDCSSSLSTSSSSSCSSTSCATVKEELCEESSSIESVDDSSRGSWFRDWMKPEAHLPPNIFADEDDICPTVTDATPLQSIVNQVIETHFSPNDGAEVLALPTPPLPALKHVSFFTHKEKEPLEEGEGMEDEKSVQEEKRIVPISYYEERKLLKKLDAMQNLNPELYRLRRKLKVRLMKREHNLPLFNIDAEVKFFERTGRLMIPHERNAALPLFSNPYPCGETARVLDRFQLPERRIIERGAAKPSFRARLTGSSNICHELIHSPYSLRKMKPFIFRDLMTTPLKLKLLQEIVAYSRRKDKDLLAPSPRLPIDYQYVTPKHIPAMNHLAREFFWPGIDLSEVLHYPDFTCVVLYGNLVIGFGVIVPDTNQNEAYVSFLFVHPEWRRAGLAKFILYHLIQTCSGKDITLHVSATNPALILYQQFGFKVEEFLSDFYDKYLPEDSPECKHAMFLRLRR